MGDRWGQSGAGGAGGAGGGAAMRGLRAGGAAGGAGGCRALPRGAAWLDGWFMERRGGGSCAWAIQPWGWAAIAGLALLLGVLGVLLVWLWRHRGAVEAEAAAEALVAGGARGGGAEPPPGAAGEARGAGCWGWLRGPAEQAGPAGGGSRGAGAQPGAGAAPPPGGGGEHRPLLTCGEVPPDVSSQRGMEMGQWMGSLPADDAAFIKKHLQLTVKEADLQTGAGPARRGPGPGRKFKQIVPMGDAGPGAMPPGPPARPPTLAPLSPKAGGGAKAAFGSPKAALGPRSPSERRAAGPGGRKAAR